MRLFLITIFSVLGSSLYSQNDSIKLGAKFGSYNEELTEMYQMTNMEVYQFHLLLKEIRDSKIKFSYLEFKDGSFKEEKPIFPKEGLDMKNPRGDFENDSIYTFKVAAQKKMDNTVEMWVRFPSFGLNRLSFQTLSTDNYSLRDFITTTGNTHLNIPIGKKLPFLAYSLPYEQDGMLYYCSITTDGIRPEQWAEIYGIEHYIIFYMEIIE